MKLDKKTVGITAGITALASAVYYSPLLPNIPVVNTIGGIISMIVVGAFLYFDGFGKNVLSRLGKVILGLTLVLSGFYLWAPVSFIANSQTANMVFGILCLVFSLYGFKTSK